MENFAYTTLLILVFSLPGYVTRTAYHSGVLDKSVLPKSLANELGAAFLTATPLHLGWWAFVEFLADVLTLVPDVNLTIVFSVLFGFYGPESVTFKAAVNNIYENSWWVISYLIFLIMTSYLVGWMFRMSVWHWKLDLKHPNIFGFGNTWLYTITGRICLNQNPGSEDVIPVADALVNIGEKTRLYRGVIEDFTTDEKGNLLELSLLETMRGKFSEETGLFYWERIPGNVFILKYSEILNLNITYLHLPA